MVIPYIICFTCKFSKCFRELSLVGSPDTDSGEDSHVGVNNLQWRCSQEKPAKGWEQLQQPKDRPPKEVSGWSLWKQSTQKLGDRHTEPVRGL